MFALPTQIESIDIQLAKALAPLGDTAAGRAFCKLGGLSDQPPIRIALGATIAAASAKGDRKLVAAAFRALLSHQLATTMKGIIEHRIDRTRPRKLIDEGQYVAKPGKTDNHAFNSFPSGHTAGAVAVAEAFARIYPEQRAAARGVAATMAAARLPDKSHYLSDVIAGAVIGYLAEQVVAMVWPVERQRAPR